jgi:hypothetical protein
LKSPKITTSRRAQAGWSGEEEEEEEPERSKMKQVVREARGNTRKR